MKKRFIILINSQTEEQVSAFQAYVEESKDFGWWHWLYGSWLLTTYDQQMTAIKIREVVNEKFPGVHNIVIELRGDGTDTWAGFGPQTESSDMFKWLKKNWKNH